MPDDPTHASLEGDPSRPVGGDVDERGWGGKYLVQRGDQSDQPGGKHENCRLLVLDLTHDPDAQAAARTYAARVVHRRPRLSADLREHLGTDDLRPGERYVEAADVDFASAHVDTPAGMQTTDLRDST